MTDTTAAGRDTRPGPDSVLLGRFRLVDRVGDGGGSSLWHAVDQRLRRAVGVRVTPLDHPSADRLRTAAIDASMVTDRRAVPVLDIADDEESGQLVIVTEWLAATPFGQLLAARDGEPLPPAEAAAELLPYPNWDKGAKAWISPDGKTKVIYRVQENVWELYDLATDPGEQKNLYRDGDPRSDEGKAALTKWMERAGAN